MQISPVSIHHLLHKSPAQPLPLLPHPHQIVKIHHCCLLLQCFQYISEERVLWELKLVYVQEVCMQIPFANLVESLVLVHFTLCYNSCKQLTNVVDVCLPIIVFLHTFNRYIIIFDQTKSNSSLFE